MGDAIGQTLASAVAIAVSPMALIAVVLMLAGPRERAAGAAFAAGWTLATAAAAGVSVLAGSVISGGGSRPDWAWWLELCGGLLLPALFLRRWHQRPRAGHVHPPPRWMRAIDRYPPGRCAGLAARLVGGDPKNLVAAVVGGVLIGTSPASAAGKTMAVVVMVLVGALGALLPLGVRLFGGARSATVLSEWKAWMSAHQTAITMVVLLMLGADYVGGAISGLAPTG